MHQYEECKLSYFEPALFHWLRYVGATMFLGSAARAPGFCLLLLGSFSKHLLRLMARANLFGFYYYIIVKINIKSN